MSPSRRPAAPLALAALALLVGLAPAPPAVAPRQDDDEQAERRELARRSVTESCLMCHSAEMVEAQRLTPKQWATEVDKMIGWGAPVRPEERQPMIDYLAAAFSTDTPPIPPARLAASDLCPILAPDPRPTPSDGDADAGAKLYAAHCATCHGAAAQGGDLGTNLVEHRVLLRPDDYGRVVREGRRKMPGFGRVLTPSQEADALAWLRRQRLGASKP